MGARLPELEAIVARARTRQGTERSPRPLSRKWDREARWYAERLPALADRLNGAVDEVNVQSQRTALQRLFAARRRAIEELERWLDEAKGGGAE